MQRLYQQVADKLARAIMVGDYAVGARLPAERDLADQFHVSRPTIREAIIALEIQNLVQVRTGSGVYVVEAPKPSAEVQELDIGPFELTEARRMFEGEGAALAATLVTDDELATLSRTLDDMVAEIDEGTPTENADRTFHVLIAQATRNSAIVRTVEELWDIRDNSPVCIRLFDTVRSKGVRPAIDDHRAILDAMVRRDPREARAAMRQHLTRVIDALLEATEVEAYERARSEVEARRARYALGGDA